MVPGRFKDYISTPKQNEYRSLHTTIIGPRQQRVELQIRTREMDEIAEYGIAAHPLYKDGIADDRDRLAAESRAYAWLRQTVEQIAHGDAPEEFLEHTKLELFQDQVFCFTPKGRLIALPRGATPIDFAYAVHTDVGDTCIGAKVNGQLVAARPAAAERRRGGDRPLRRAAAAGGVGSDRRDRQGARRHPPRQPQPGAAAICRARPPHAGAPLRAGRESRSATRRCRHAAARLNFPRSTTCWPRSGAGQLSPDAVLKEVHPDYRDERVSRAGAAAARRAGRRRSGRA